MLFQYNKNIVSGAFVTVCCIISLVNITSNTKGLKLLSVSSTDDTEYSDWMQVGDKSFRVAKAAIMDKNPVDEEPECHVCRNAFKNKSEPRYNLEQWHSGHEKTKTVEHTELVCADCKKKWLDEAGTCPMCRVQIAKTVAEKAEWLLERGFFQEESEEDDEWSHRRWSLLEQEEDY